MPYYYQVLSTPVAQVYQIPQGVSKIRLKAVAEGGKGGVYIANNGGGGGGSGQGIECDLIVLPGSAIIFNVTKSHPNSDSGNDLVITYTPFAPSSIAQPTTITLTGGVAGGNGTASTGGVGGSSGDGVSGGVGGTSTTLPGVGTWGHGTYNHSSSGDGGFHASYPASQGSTVGGFVGASGRTEPGLFGTARPTLAGRGGRGGSSIFGASIPPIDNKRPAPGAGGWGTSVAQDGQDYGGYAAFLLEY